MEEKEKIVKSNKDIELRSEEAQELLGDVPSWILRRGLTLVFVFLLLILAGSYFFKYPDIITAQVKVTTANPPAAIISRASGKIRRLYVEDKQMVHGGDYLAVIENNALTEDVWALKERLQEAEKGERTFAADSLVPRLGDIQSAYITFLNASREKANFEEMGLYDKKIAIQEQQVERQGRHLERLQRQAVLSEEQFQIARRRWEKDSVMHSKGGISGTERDNTLSTYLQNQQNKESTESGLETQQMQIAQLNADLIQMRLEKMEREGKIVQDYNQAMEQLRTALKNWEMQYALISPIEGQVTFTTYWSENHTVSGGEMVFVVVPHETEEIVGKALLPVERSGKVKEGQRVNVRFDNYPDQEYGMVRGVVSSISLVPVEGHYVVGITFPDGLLTNYKKMLPLSQEMTGSADVITDDLRLIERFFTPMKKIFNGGMNN